MKTAKGYRYTLQFPDVTAYQRQIGEFLEQLGSKKSRFIVMALSEYLAEHPEKMKASGKLHPSIGSFSRDDMKDIVREVLAERGMVIQLSDEAQPAEPSDASVNAMLESMKAFM
ncbi:MAG: hypothetical protein FWC27_14680 [Firmicutes bacterium]|nr:hypothetical protein [Bacillota bacterium]